MKLKQPIKLKDLAALLELNFTGDPEMLITGINEIHKVEQGDLTFVDVEKYYEKALKSAATFILINKNVACPQDKCLLISEKPFEHFKAIVLRYMIREIFPENPNFYLSEEAVIGKGTRVFPGVYIANDVIIGSDCTILPNVVIHSGTIIGDRVTIKANSVIGGDAFYFKGDQKGYHKWPSCGRVLIGNDVYIGSCVTIDKGVSGDTVIGSHTIIDNHIHIAHGVEIGDKCLFAAQSGVAGKTIIGNHVTVLGQSGIIKDVKVGDNATLLSKSLITKSVKGGKTYFGNPADEVREVNRQLAALRNLAEWMKEKDEELKKIRERI